jgi:GTP pyrophosphokinase
VGLVPPTLISSRNHPPTIERLMALLRDHLSADDQDKIRRAYDFAAAAHEGQIRQSGDPYIRHPLAVTIILAEMSLLDADTLAAALLHDVIEDSGVSRATLAAEFGETVAALVDGVTKLSTLPKAATGGNVAETERREREQRANQQAEALRKMFIAMFDDIRVVLIKLADRLHNMRTLNSTPPDKQRRIAQQTLDIYAPLANRMGMWQIKSELEDLAFYFLEPEKYLELAGFLKERKEARERYIQRVSDHLQKALQEAGVEARLSGRTKHIYSLYQKMQRKNRPVEHIYDVLAIRVIVKEMKDCYAALGVIHTLWIPITGEFDDYIAKPKETLYQSLHTAVLALEGKPLEIQIRTEQMHEVAEFGIAAHWRYKEGGTSRRDRAYEAKIADLRRRLSWRNEVQDAQEFVENLHSEMFQDRIYVYTPKGEIVELAAGSTPIDFAYHIHTELGHQCGGARVNDRIVPLDTPLQNGDRVQILKERQRKGPSRDWISSGRTYVTTATARGKIRQWFRRQRRDENIAQGRNIVEDELRKLGQQGLDEAAVLAHFPRYSTYDDLLEAIGSTDINPAQLANRLAPPPEKIPLPRVQVPPSNTPPALEVGGATNLLVSIARCCKPMPGDDIIGYTTRGRGITVHRASCRNIENVRDRERLIKVAWSGISNQRYLAQLTIVALDRVGLLRDVLTKVADEKVNVQEINNTNNGNGGTQTVRLTLEVAGMEQLSTLISRLDGISGVYEVYRDVPQDRGTGKAK